MSITKKGSDKSGNALLIALTNVSSHVFALYRYFLVTSNYFFYGESLVGYFNVLVSREHLLTILVRYHRFISFSL